MWLLQILLYNATNANIVMLLQQQKQQYPSPLVLIIIYCICEKIVVSFCLLTSVLVITLLLSYVIYFNNSIRFWQTPKNCLEKLIVFSWVAPEANFFWRTKNRQRSRSLGDVLYFCILQHHRWTWLTWCGRTCMLFRLKYVYIWIGATCWWMQLCVRW